jgi:high-affinity Fe2+/Pb2+ permease
MPYSSPFRFNSGPLRGTGQPDSLLGRIVGLVLGIAVLAISVIVGAVFLAALVGLILIVAVVVMLRVWWLKRKMQRHEQQHGDLDAEYTVVRETPREIDHKD